MNHFFDLLIAILFVATAFPAVILLYHRKKDKKSWEYGHKKTTLGISLILLIGTVILLYGSFVEPRLLVVNEQKIDLDGIEEPVRIAIVSDFQAGTYRKEADLNRIVDTILSEHPDIVLLGGDQVDNMNMDEDDTAYLKPLGRLAEAIPTYAVHGNHEYGISGGKSMDDPRRRVGNVTREAKKYLEDLGIRYLVNEMDLVTSTPSSFYLFGGDEYWSKKLDFAELKKREDEQIPILALVHNPAAAYFASKYDIDLMLSGHTHGGQIRFPFIGPVGRIDHTTPAKWYQGLNSVDEMKLFVTSGAGETGARARLFNPPEIVLLTIK